ncbi:MAG: hypothetical protein AMXMBFR84_10500 [Candidatus Hydrogenedentota bacterium]
MITRMHEHIGQVYRTRTTPVLSLYRYYYQHQQPTTKLRFAVMASLAVHTAILVATTIVFATRPSTPEIPIYTVQFVGNSQDLTPVNAPPDPNSPVDDKLATPAPAVEKKPETPKPTPPKEPVQVAKKPDPLPEPKAEPVKEAKKPDPKPEPKAEQTKPKDKPAEKKVEKKPEPKKPTKEEIARNIEKEMAKLEAGMRPDAPLDLDAPATDKTDGPQGAPRDAPALKQGVNMNQLPTVLGTWGSLVMRRVEQVWRTPSGIVANPDLNSVLVSFWVTREGQLFGEPEVVRPALDSAVTESAIKAIKEAQPFPRVPESYREPEVQVVFTFVPAI